MQGAEKFCSTAYGWYDSKKFSPQRSSWDEIWIIRGTLKFIRNSA